MECRFRQCLEFGETRSRLIIGEVLVFHIRDGLLNNGKIETEALDPIARIAPSVIVGDFAGRPFADPAMAPLLQIQAFYRLVNALSVARGYDPDRPRHLSKITETL